MKFLHLLQLCSCWTTVQGMNCGYGKAGGLTTKGRILKDVMQGVQVQCDGKLNDVLLCRLPWTTGSHSMKTRKLQLLTWCGQDWSLFSLPTCFLSGLTGMT
jgi:hypothetical protein